MLNDENYTDRKGIPPIPGQGNTLPIYVFSSFEAGHCVSNSSFKLRKIEKTQFSSTGAFIKIKRKIYRKLWQYSSCVKKDLTERFLNTKGYFLRLQSVLVFYYTRRLTYTGMCTVTSKHTLISKY